MASASFFGLREEDMQNYQIVHQQHQNSSEALPASPPAAAPVKKKRNLPGTPNPDAEVIALSPKTLMATNRFICEVCNKGFQREQNLQLHRRGHNLPWKLKQKSTKDVRRKVYLCPEPTCVHHDPSRALGDLTGIKKHFSRKHGEKKWKCEKCAKRYAVQSDWKAHMKVCGTREYRCDCGTLFSRRDSFITHRAFCDALAQETSRLPPANSNDNQLYRSSNMDLGLTHLNSQISSLNDHHRPSSDLLNLGSNGASPHFNHLISNHSPFYMFPSNPDFADEIKPHYNLLDTKPYQGLMQHSNTNTSSSNAAAANLFNHGFDNSSTSDNQNLNILFPGQFGSLVDDHVGAGMPTIFSTSMRTESSLPQMSATALLQKAAQMGSTSSGGSGGGGSSSLLINSRFAGGTGSGSSGESLRSHMENENNFNEMMMFGRSRGSSSYDQQELGFGGFSAALQGASLQRNLSAGGIGGSDGLTRDFLGVGNMLRSMGSGISQHELHHGLEMGSFHPEMK